MVMRIHEPDEENLRLRYIRVANDIKRDILDGKYRPGEQLPAQHELARRHGIAFNTLRYALDLLERDQFIIRRMGRGTYVAGPEDRKRPILVVDDDATVGSLMKAFLQDSDWHVETATSGGEALKLLAAQPFDMIFLDLIMPGMNGPETLKKIRAQGIDTPVVITTGYPDSALVAEVLEMGPTAMLRKPFTQDQVQITLNRYASRVRRAA